MQATIKQTRALTRDPLDRSSRRPVGGIAFAGSSNASPGAGNGAFTSATLA